MRIEKISDTYVAYIPFSMKDDFQRAGWVWDRILKKWTTTELSKAAEWSEFAVGSARQDIEEYMNGLVGNVADSMATNSDISIPSPEGLDYLGFQKAGVSYSANRRDVLIADPPGLGKTIQAIGVSNYYRDTRRILVICPTYLKKNWEREWKRWDVHGQTVGRANLIKQDKKDKHGNIMRKPPKEGQKTGARIKESVPTWPTVANVPESEGGKETDVVIIHDYLVPLLRDYIDSVDWDILIVDECHAYVNEKASRSIQIWGNGIKNPKKRIRAIRAKKRIFLTGTPITKEPSNMWVFCKHLDPKGLGSNWLTFHKRYCDAFKDFGRWNISGNSNLEELNFKLRDSFMVRRDKKEVLKDLPPKFRQLVVLEDDGLVKQVQDEINWVGKVLEEYESLLGIDEDATPEEEYDALGKLFPENFEDMSYEEMASYLSNEMQATFEEGSSVRKALAVAKAPLVREHVDTLLESLDKVIVFCHHNDVADALRKQFPGCAFISGKIHADKRQEQVDRFQEDPDCHVIVCTIGSAGTGFTMTAASYVIFAELAWLPYQIEQAEDRAWRIGQLQCVIVQHLVIQGSMDARFVEILIERMDMIDRALSPEKALQRGKSV